MSTFNKLMLALMTLVVSIDGYAEGEMSPLSVRGLQGTAQWVNRTLPTEARQAVMPDAWRNTGSITCAQSDTSAGGVTYCSHFASHRFTAANRDSGRYNLQLRAPASHCSPIVYVAYIDVAEGGTTPYYFGALYPGASYVRGITVRPGNHTITIGAIGDTGMGGCNTAGIQSWSVDVRVEPDAAPN